MADNRKYAKALLDYVQMPMAQLGAVFGTTPQKMSKALRQEGSNIYESMKSAVTAPGRALQGQMNPQMLMDENGNITQDDSKMNQEGMNFALNFMGSGSAPAIGKPMGKGELGITAYHGSPATNIEKFDRSKIGAGTGINAYSPGFYFSEAPTVAKGYQNRLSGYNSGTQSLLKRFGGDIDKAMQEAQRSMDFYKKSVEEGGNGDLRRANSLLEIQQNKLNDLMSMKAGNPENKGALYTVDIADESIPKMLDWENEVPENIRKSLSEKAMKQWDSGVTGQSGQALYNEITKNFEWSGSKNPREDAVKWLLENDVPGMKYLDRGQDNLAGTNAQNYVVYDPNLIKILNKK